MHGRVLLATLAAALLLAAPARRTCPRATSSSTPARRPRPARRTARRRWRRPAGRSRGPFTAVAYGAPAFPTAEDAARLGGGANFFAGGPDGDVNTASQVIDVSAGARRDRRRGVTGTLSALIGGYASQDDGATVSAAAARRRGHPIAPRRPCSRRCCRPSARASATCCRRTASVAIPLDTRLDRASRSPRRAPPASTTTATSTTSASASAGRRSRGKSVGAQAVSGHGAGEGRAAKFVPLAPACSRTAPRSTRARAASRSPAPTAARPPSTTASSSSRSPAGSRR